MAEERLEMRLGISPTLDKKLRRIKDLLSQKSRNSVSLEESLEAMANAFLEKHDPIQKAERLLARKAPPPCSIDEPPRKRKAPAQVIHAVNLRDRTQCAFMTQGIRCSQTRWIQKHHLKLFSEGGKHELGNFQTLCFHHHKKIHEDLARTSV